MSVNTKLLGKSIVRSIIKATEDDTIDLTIAEVLEYLEENMEEGDEFKVGEIGEELAKAKDKEFIHPRKTVAILEELVKLGNLEKDDDDDDEDTYIYQGQ